MSAGEVHYDAIIIGTGQGGKPLAHALAKSGRKTAIIERDHVGGTCVNYGCTPTKTMVASARIAYLARRAAEYGVNCENVLVDAKKVVQRKQAIVESFRNSGRKGLEEAENLDFLPGEASFLGSHVILVEMTNGEKRQISADTIVINTGGRPQVPPITGLDAVPYLDSTSIMEVDLVPPRLLVIGGGYIGLEFGQMFARFGSDVVIIQRGPQLVPREDADVADAVAKILQEDGIAVYLSTDATKVEKNDEDEILLTLRSDNDETVITGSDLLIAAGRVPNTETLNLDAAGIVTTKHGHVQVNDRFETSVPGVYAIGDVNGGPQFTHVSYDDFRILKTNLIDGGNASRAGRMVPYTMFIDPQLGRIGMSEKEASRQGRKVRIAKIPMTWVARALEMDEARGLIKAVVDVETDEILGCTVVGIEGGEIASMVQIAMMGKLPFTALRDGIFSHPGLAECLNTLFSSFEEST